MARKAGIRQYIAAMLGASSRKAKDLKPLRSLFSERGSRRTRSGMSTKKRQEISMAKKRSRVHQKATRRHADSKEKMNLMFIFVGHLDPTVTEGQLIELFESCGIVTRVQIRCSIGTGVTIGMPIPLGNSLQPAHQYATIAFREPIPAHYALQLNGMLLNGQRIVVALTAIGLPDVQQLTARHSTTPPFGVAGSSPSFRSPSKPHARGLFNQSTRIIMPRPATPAKQLNKHVLFGMSFPKTVA